jgi:YD repeat-containing protein
LIWIYHYNEHNSLISQLYPNGYYLQYRYDSFNQLDRVYRANGSVKKTYYDGPGNKIREIESNGEVTTSEYDALCRSVKQTVETGPPESRQKKVSVFRYNAVNSKIYDAITGLPIAHYKWDGLQRLIKYKKGKDWPKTYRFSANGCSDLFQSSQWDSSCHRAGLAVLWFCKYDGLQRLVQQSCGIFRFLAFPPFYTPRFINTYDAVGNLLKKKDGFTTTRYEYDALNRLVTTYPPGGGWTRTLRTSTGLEYGTLDSSGHRIEKRFDAAGEEIIS